MVEGPYEMPVPLKSQKVNHLPNNNENALKRTMLKRKTTQCDPNLKQTLVETITELIAETVLNLSRKIFVLVLIPLGVYSFLLQIPLAMPRVSLQWFCYF